LLLSHAPIEKTNPTVKMPKEGKFTQCGGGREEYIDRAQSMEELDSLCKVCFGDKLRISYAEFKKIMENVTSEMFFCIYSLIKTHFPTLAQFKKYEQALNIKADLKPHVLPAAQILASPKILSKFSPVSRLAKFSTPQVELHVTRMKKREEGEVEDSTSPKAQKPYLTKLVKQQFGNKNMLPSKLLMSPIASAARLANTKIQSKDLIKSPSLFLGSEHKTETLLFCECGKEITDLNKLLCADCMNRINQPKCEVYLYKQIVDKEFKSFWVVAEKRELFCINNALFNNSF